MTGVTSNTNLVLSDEDKIQINIVKCIGQVGKRVVDPAEKLEAMTYIMDKLKGIWEFYGN